MFNLFKRTPKPLPIRAAYAPPAPLDSDAPAYKWGAGAAKRGEPCERRVFYIGTLTYGERPDEEWRLYALGHAHALARQARMKAEANAKIDALLASFATPKPGIKP
jgi:hypothetical protein